MGAIRNNNDDNWWIFWTVVAICYTIIALADMGVFNG